MDITRIRKPRCFLLYALAPPALPPAEANQTLNAICADEHLPLAIFHDHFIGQPGGLVIFFAGTAAERDALQTHLDAALAGWEHTLHPLIFSFSPAAFDEQIAFTLRAYRGRDWAQLRQEQRPAYGSPAEEAQTAEESP